MSTENKDLLPHTRLEQFGAYLSGAGLLLAGTATAATVGPINTAVKIAATVVSIFIPEEKAAPVHLIAKNGLVHYLPSDKSLFKSWAKTSFELSNMLSLPYTFILQLISLSRTPTTKISLGNQLQTILFKKTASLTESEYAAISKGFSRIAFFGATLLVVVAKVIQLGLALLATALSLITSGGFLGCWEGLNTFAKSNLKIDILETLCDGLRYTFEPTRALKELKRRNNIEDSDDESDRKSITS